MLKPQGALIILASLAALGGCATVSVYEPVAAEISLTQEQSELHKASNAYCERARRKGLATGEASIGTLADLFSGKSNDANAYWRRIGADRSSPASVVSRIRADMNDATKGLADLTSLADDMMTSTTPTRTDVNQFELALIHARQARDSLSDAFIQVNKRSSREYQTDLELEPLDEALARARQIADELAAARTSETTASAAMRRRGA